MTAIGRLSDSQLDMLGLAAHLVTLEREASGQPVFIDDPTDMLDHPTREKLAHDGIDRLLGKVDGVPGRQVVVLTHDDQLVQSLWYHHGRNWPCTMQAVIELDRTPSVPEAIVAPRSAGEYLTRVDALLEQDRNDGSRIWLRNAAGNLTRQALELIVKDLLTVVGPLGQGYLTTADEHAIAQDKRGLGTAFDELRKVLDAVTERQRQCGSLQHRSALLLADKLNDAVDRRKDFLLDQASHPGFVYPSATQIKGYAKSLREFATKLESQENPDEWPRRCRWYMELTLCQDCGPYPN